MLQDLPSTPQLDDLRAVVCSRMGLDDEGREFFFKACEADPALEFRGRLDPEINTIIDFDKLEIK